MMSSEVFRASAWRKSLARTVWSRDGNRTANFPPGIGTTRSGSLEGPIEYFPLTLRFALGMAVTSLLNIIVRRVRVAVQWYRAVSQDEEIDYLIALELRTDRLK